MLVTANTQLADVLKRWMERERVSAAHIARFSNPGGHRVSRNTIDYLLGGTTKSPEMDTLRKIARGLAHHPRTLRYNHAVYVRALQDLAIAAALTLPEGELGLVSLEDLIEEAIRDQVDAETLAEAIRQFPTATEEDRRLLLRAARLLLND